MFENLKKHAPCIGYLQASNAEVVDSPLASPDGDRMEFRCPGWISQKSSSSARRPLINAPHCVRQRTSELSRSHSSSILRWCLIMSNNEIESRRSRRGFQNPTGFRSGPRCLLSELTLSFRPQLRSTRVIQLLTHMLYVVSSESLWYPDSIGRIGGCTAGVGHPQPR